MGGGVSNSGVQSTKRIPISKTDIAWTLQKLGIVLGNKVKVSKMK